MSHLDNAREFLSIAEAIDGSPQEAKRNAYRAAAEEIAAHKAETGDSNRAIARVVQYAASTIDKLLAWRDAGYPGDSPHTPPGSSDRVARSHAKRSLRNPGERRRVIEDLTTDERRELVDDVIEADPEVADAVERKVETRQAERKFQSEQRRLRGQKPLPLSAYFHRLTGRIAEWARDLGFILKELRENPDTLTAVEKTKVDENLVDLIAVAESIRLELNPGLRRTGIDEDIIEGSAS